MAEHGRAYEYAKKYYPTLWNEETLQSLVQAGKLYDWEYEEITGTPYPND